MQPKVVALEPFAVVGLKYHGKNAEGEIPQMWGALMQRSGESRSHHSGRGDRAI